MTGTQDKAPALRQLGNVHHAAFRCRDAAQTRWFYEEVLGLPLSIALVFDEVADTGIKREYMHLFFKMADGNFIAFFDEPDRATPAHFERKESFDVHIALEAESFDAMMAWKERINRAGKSCLGPVNHGFVHSVYMYDPNGLQVEITSKSPEYDAILAEEGSMVEQVMSDWTARTRAQKEALFGAAAIDRRASK